MANITGRGMFQEDLVTVMDAIVTGWTATLTKLDADTTVADGDYYDSGDSDYVVSHSATSTGMEQKDVVDFIKDYITAYNLVLAKLDSDSGATNTYVSGLAMTDPVDSLSAGNIYPHGLNQGNLMYELNQIITSNNALNAALNADGLQLNNYDDNDVTDTVDESDCYQTG